MSEKVLITTHHPQKIARNEERFQSNHVTMYTTQADTNLIVDEIFKNIVNIINLSLFVKDFNYFSISRKREIFTAIYLLSHRKSFSSTE